MANADNPGTGKRFELAVQRFLEDTQNLKLARPFRVEIGANDEKRPHLFDLGSQNQRTVVECKAHSWTVGGNSPSAKLAAWNEAMYYFSLTPGTYRKLFFVKLSLRKDVSLFRHYVHMFSHLIPKDIEIWEFNEVTNRGACKYKGGRDVVQLTPEELGGLAEELASESDPARAQTLKERIMAGFYGNEVHA